MIELIGERSTRGLGQEYCDQVGGLLLDKGINCRSVGGVQMSAREVQMSAREVQMSASEVQMSAREVQKSAREVLMSPWLWMSGPVPGMTGS